MSRILASNRLAGCGLALAVLLWGGAAAGLVLLGQHLGWW